MQEMIIKIIHACRGRRQYVCKMGQLRFKMAQTFQILVRLGEQEEESRASSWRVQRMIDFLGEKPDRNNNEADFPSACKQASYPTNWGAATMNLGGIIKAWDNNCS